MYTDFGVMMTRCADCLKQVTDAEGECSAVDLVARNQSLEVEVTMLRQKLAETSHLLISRPLPLEDALLPRLSCDKATTTISHNNREIVPHQQQTGAVVA